MGNNENAAGPRAESEDERAVDNRTLLLRLLRLSLRHKGPCFRVLTYQLLVIGMTLGGLSFAGLAIDYIHSRVDASVPAPSWPLGLAPPTDWSAMGVVAVLAGCVLLFAVIKGILTYIYSVSVAKLVQRDIVAKIRSDVYRKLQSLSLSFYQRNSSGSIINRVTGDVQSLRMFVDGVILPSVILAIALAVYLTYMFSIHAWLTMACMATTPLLYAITILFAKRVGPLYIHNRRLADAMILRLSESVQGITVVKGFGREAEQTERFHRANHTVQEQQQDIFWKISLYTPAVGMLTQLNIVVLLAYGGFLVLRAELPLGAGLVVFAGILQQLSQRVASIAQITNSIQQSLTGARRVFEVLDAPLEVASPKNPIHVKQAEGRVTFEDVFFHYREHEPVLRDISFDVSPDQRIAILGQTGSGKSLLLGLIPRFHDPVKGVVRLDGYDLRSLELNSLRQRIGIVFQESFLFSTTVAANIALGHPSAPRGKIERAARLAAAHDFITALPKGYDTVLGEAAVNLSGGQRQRLAIARAILLDPSILILDDPTAAIDAQTEKEIMHGLDSAMAGRTTFIVAHRLSTLRRADLILVLDRGQIVQRGTHDELLHQRGPYLQVARLQLADADELFPRPTRDAS